MNWFLFWLKWRGSWRNIDRDKLPYLERYFLLKLFGRALYLHQFWSSDDDAGPHDHPWRNASLVLKGGYREWFHDGTYKDRKPGDFVIRDATTLHRIELLPGTEGKVWSLFFTGKRVRLWGFLTKNGWIEASEMGVAVSNKDFILKGWIFPRVVWLNK